MQRAAHPPRTAHGSGSSGSGDSGGNGSGQAVQTGNAHVNASACLWVCFRVFELIGSRILAIVGSSANSQYMNQQQIAMPI
jgi:hypothetical protein